MSVDDANGATVQLHGRRWRSAASSDVAWIRRSTVRGLTIASAVAPIYEAYATLLVPDSPDGQLKQLDALIELLSDFADPSLWWLAYLDTGADDDAMFEAAPRVTLYANWSYLALCAGAAQARTWRTRGHSWRQGPDLIFPADHSWLVSWLWDDQWRCVGGPATLIERLAVVFPAAARRVQLDQDATPPGHIAR